MYKMPNQPLHIAPDGVERFVPNRIVEYLLNQGPFDLNHLAVNVDATKEELAQFAQLIGYSFSGWSSLSYVTEEKYRSVEDTVKPPMTMAEIADELAKIEGYTYLADMLHPSRLVGHEHTVMARFMEKVREKIQHPVVVVQRYGKWTAQYPVGEDEWALLTDPMPSEIQALAQVLLNV